MCNGQDRVKTKHEIVISKEDAVFWMDGNGRWCNADGRFRHKKIIDHFHSAIAKDEGGYFVRQERADLVEKVYFPVSYTHLTLPTTDVVCFYGGGGGELK